MIFRPISLLTFGLAAFAGLHLYQTKHEVALLDRELRGIARAIEEAQSRTQALQAEWAWLNEPERLRGVAQRHLQLEPVTPAQFIRLNDADRKLPAAVAYAGETALFAERAPTVPAGPVQLALLPRLPERVQVAASRAIAVAPPAPTPVAPVATPEPAPLALASPAASPRPATPPAAEAAPVRPAALAAVAAPAALSAITAPAARPAEPRPAPVEVARLAPPPRPVAAPRPAPRHTPEVAALPPVAAPPRATLAPAVARVAPPSPPALRPAVTQLATTAPAAPRPADPPAIALGSALGGGRSLLPPPVPFGSANASTLTGAGLR